MAALSQEEAREQILAETRDKLTHEVASRIKEAEREIKERSDKTAKDLLAQAMQRIYSLTSWTQMQRNWLNRLAKQLHHEVVIDQQFVNRAFATDGGAKRLDAMLGGKLDNVLEALASGLWSNAA